MRDAVRFFFDCLAWLGVATALLFVSFTLNALMTTGYFPTPSGLLDGLVKSCLLISPLVLIAAAVAAVGYMIERIVQWMLR